MNKSRLLNILLSTISAIGCFAIIASPTYAMRYAWGRVYYNDNGVYRGINGINITYNLIGTGVYEPDGWVMPASNYRTITTKTVDSNNDLTLFYKSAPGTNVCTGDGCYSGSWNNWEWCEPCANMNWSTCIMYCTWIDGVCGGVGTGIRELLERSGIWDYGGGYFSIPVGPEVCLPASEQMDCHNDHFIVPSWPKDASGKDKPFVDGVPAGGTFKPLSYYPPLQHQMGNSGGFPKVPIEYVPPPVTPTPTLTLTPTPTKTPTPTLTLTPTPTKTLITPTVTVTPTPPIKITVTPTPSGKLCRIGGKKFDDLDKDGHFGGQMRYDTVINWKFYLYEIQANGTLLEPPKTDTTANGRFDGWPNSFLFTNLDCSKKYLLKEEVRSGWVPSGETSEGIENGQVSVIFDTPGDTAAYHFGNYQNKITPTPTAKLTPTPYKKGCFFEIKKTVDKSIAMAGETITYTINFTNTGASVCSGGGSRLQDQVSQHLDYVTDSAQQGGTDIDQGYSNYPIYEPSTRLLRWDTNEIVPGESGWVSWKAKVLPKTCGVLSVSNKAFMYAVELDPHNSDYYPEPDSSNHIWLASNDVITDIQNTCDVASIPTPTPIPSSEEGAKCSVMFKTVSENYCQNNQGNYTFTGIINNAPTGSYMKLSWKQIGSSANRTVSSISKISSGSTPFTINAKWPGKTVKNEKIKIRAWVDVYNSKNKKIQNCSSTQSIYYYPNIPCGPLPTAAPKKVNPKKTGTQKVLGASTMQNTIFGDVLSDLLNLIKTNIK